jgi:hypothetical protein
MTGTNCDLFTHKSSRSYLNHLVFCTTSYTSILLDSNIINSKLVKCIHTRLVKGKV